MLSAIVSTPAETIVVQQQRNGSTLSGEVMRLCTTMSPLNLYRGMVRQSNRRMHAYMPGGMAGLMCVQDKTLTRLDDTHLSRVRTRVYAHSHMRALYVCVHIVCRDGP